ncbi:RDD family protein [Phycicoccus sp. MAQZ13P-2]|uniref:RDD family protein n=1 Tax=Phycicoccus mangrovi TaxID=2840470 RepID=UPI001C0064B6|nr:RDD family protein [Phycicoccus mangrovi]MBT9258032.1 RDD family protein [Phycicoccus mangrovi]MBT9276016.1 RDD family protein [Phycicoccus mangrovi]
MAVHPAASASRPDPSDDASLRLDRSPGVAAEHRRTGRSPEPGRPAALGTRLLARLVDGLAGGGVSLGWPVLALVLGQVSTGLPAGMAEVVLAVVAVGHLVLVLAVVAVLLVATARIGQTPGQRMLGVRVVDAGTAAPIGLARAVLRTLTLAAMALPCYLGFLTFLTDPSGRNRALHDRVAATVVVEVPRVPFARAVRDVLRSLRS